MNFSDYRGEKMEPNKIEPMSHMDKLSQIYQRNQINALEDKICTLNTRLRALEVYFGLKFIPPVTNPQPTGYYIKEG